MVNERPQHVEHPGKYSAAHAPGIGALETTPTRDTRRGGHRVMHTLQKFGARMLDWRTERPARKEKPQFIVIENDGRYGNLRNRSIRGRSNFSWDRPE